MQTITPKTELSLISILEQEELPALFYLKFPKSLKTQIKQYMKLQREANLQLLFKKAPYKM
jgi:hypothetical protein